MIIGSIRFLTRIGEVIIERQLYRYRLRAGALIVDNKTVDLLRYCAWMHVVRHSPRTTNGVDSYDSMKERLGERTTTITDLTVRWTPTPVGVCTSLCCFRYGCASAPTASDNLPIAVT